MTDVRAGASVAARPWACVSVPARARGDCRRIMDVVRACREIQRPWLGTSGGPTRRRALMRSGDGVGGLRSIGRFPAGDRAHGSGVLSPAGPSSAVTAGAERGGRWR